MDLHIVFHAFEKDDVGKVYSKEFAATLDKNMIAFISLFCLAAQPFHDLVNGLCKPFKRNRFQEVANHVVFIAFEGIAGVGSCKHYQGGSLSDRRNSSPVVPGSWISRNIMSMSCCPSIARASCTLLQTPASSSLPLLLQMIADHLLCQSLVINDYAFH